MSETGDLRLPLQMHEKRLNISQLIDQLRIELCQILSSLDVPARPSRTEKLSLAHSLECMLQLASVFWGAGGGDDETLG